MKKILLLAILFISSCSSSLPPKSNFNLTDEINFDEFKLKLEEYAKKNPYPSLND